MAKVGILDIIIKNLKLKLVITNKIYNECTLKKEDFDAKIIQKRLEERVIEKMEIKNLNLYNKTRTDFNLGEGEAEAIVFCLENKIPIITDDKKAMNVCKILRIRFTTFLNLLVRLYKKGIITTLDANLYLNKLQKFGRYSDFILQKAKEEIK